MLNEEFFDRLKEQAKSYSESGGGHEFSHTERVYNNALKISKNKNVDLDIVKAAALLHDIARKKEDKGECGCHAEEGGKMARDILAKTNFPKEKIEKVVYAIEVHRHSKNILPETKEAEILQDADRLDALGAITIARMFSTGGKIGRPLHIPNLSQEKFGRYSTTSINGFYNKILKIKPETFKTKEAKQIAEGRYKYVEDFIKRFMNEWEGKE